MPALTRRRDPKANVGAWHLYYGDVRVGTIAIRTGIPHDEDPWEWRCGFYRGSHPGEHTNGTGATFDEARAGFDEAWRFFLPKRTEANLKSIAGSVPGRRGSALCTTPAANCRRSFRKAGPAVSAAQRSMSRAP
jgi:hypothetical protein